MTICFSSQCARVGELVLRGGPTGGGADVEVCGPCAADLIDAGRVRRLGAFGLEMIQSPAATVPSVRNCGECLMDAVEIVQLSPAGVCPRCRADYGQ